MTPYRVQCPCGHVVSLPSVLTLLKLRCPGCGSNLRIKLDAPAPEPPVPPRPAGATRKSSLRRPPNPPPRPRWHDKSRPSPEPPPIARAPPGQSPPVGEPDEYELSLDGELVLDPPRSQDDFPSTAWVPRDRPSPPLSRRPRTASDDRPLPADDDESAFTIEPPARPAFLNLAALFYPWLHPTWISWIGLSFVSTVAVLMLAGTSFLFGIVVTFGLVGSIFSMAFTVMGCLALTAYLMTVFISVVETSAHGGTRLDRLPGMAWVDILPAFRRTVSAGLLSGALAYGLTYPLHNYFEWNDPKLLVIKSVVSFVLFPILMIAYLADDAWLPIAAFFATLRRIVYCAGYFLLFLILVILLDFATGLAVGGLFSIHLAAGLLGSGTILATRLLYYGHFLGRLCRKMIAVE